MNLQFSFTKTGYPCLPESRKWDKELQIKRFRTTESDSFYHRLAGLGFRSRLLTKDLDVHELFFFFSTVSCRDTEPTRHLRRIKVRDRQGRRST